MRATITNLHGETERVSLPTPIYDNHGPQFREDYGTGIKLERVWFGPKTKRAIIQTDSIWQERNGHGVVGERFREIETYELLQICDKFDIPVPEALEQAAATID